MSQTLFPKPNAKRQKRLAEAKERARAKAFRAAIWAREDGKDRATGVQLATRTSDLSYLGDVCHLKPKGRYPELRYETSNAILLSRRHHILSDGRGGYRLKIEGEDANQALTFRMFDRDGVELWSRTTRPRRPVGS